MTRGFAISIAGLASALPLRRVGNEVVSRLVGIPAGRIRELFDIEERGWTRPPSLSLEQPDESLADLAARAAAAAIADAGIEPRDIDAIIAASTTSEYVAPALDYLVQRKLGCSGEFACSLHGACTSLFRASLLAARIIESGTSRTVLIVLADAVSPFFVFGHDHPKDLRMSMALYGDGAAAMVLVPERAALPRASHLFVRANTRDDDPGIALSWQRVASTRAPSGGEAGAPAYHDFRRVLREGGKLTLAAARAVLEHSGLSFDDIDHLLTHQATGNMRRVAAELGLPAEKLRINIEHVGNTLAPSILILLDELRRQGQLESGQRLLLASAESATWSYGGMLIDWA
ncbi:MAG: hypothetical protein D6760_07540 [Deltaproteobacteria bacterium]|nr:MAG: hypothetical protein D6760_07540 [Deltaproteobacteria bacterium]